MFQEWDTSLTGLKDYPELRQAVKRWCEQQDGQRILLTTPSVLVGFRVEVYRAEGTTQWYTAVIIGYNEATRVSSYKFLCCKIAALFVKICTVSYYH